jgi:hypothetical protein
VPSQRLCRFLARDVTLGQGLLSQALDYPILTYSHGEETEDWSQSLKDPLPAICTCESVAIREIR